MRIEETDYQYINKLLADPGLLQAQEFKEWMQDKEHYEMFWNAKAALDASLLKEDHLPELAIERERFQQATGTPLRSHRSRFQSASFLFRRQFLHWGAAAAILLLIGVSIFLYMEQHHSHVPLPLVQALPFPQLITLSSNTGDTLLLYQKDTVYTAVPNRQVVPTYNTIRTPRGKDFCITLSDGTEVRLNAESSLRYPVSFEGKERVVELQGEAYFKVARDEKKAFIVQTDHVQTKVLGTGFNVRAYPGKQPHVTLVEGSVAVRTNNQKEAIVLNPGEDACVANETGTMEVRAVDVRKYTSWTSGHFFFEDSTLEDIMRELGCWYNVNVVFANPEVMKLHFNFWADRTRDVREALDMLQQVNKVKITYKDETITIS